MPKWWQRELIILPLMFIGQWGALWAFGFDPLSWDGLKVIGFAVYFMALGRFERNLELPDDVFYRTRRR